MGVVLRLGFETATVTAHGQITFHTDETSESFFFSFIKDKLVQNIREVQKGPRHMTGL